jgi:hypothetical protein
VQAGEHPTTALDAKEEDQGKSGRWLFLEAFPVALPMATISAMASSQESTGSRLMARPAALLLLLAALAAPAQARSAPENRAGEKSAQNTELLLSPTPQLLELQREKVTARWYDASGDSFAPKTAPVKVYRKMSAAEAEQALSSQQLPPRVSGSNSNKYVSESLEKVQNFQNKGVAQGTQEVILEFEVDAAQYAELRAMSIPQQGSAGSGKIVFNTEGLSGTELRNLGIPESQLGNFNKIVISVKKVP